MIEVLLAHRTVPTEAVIIAMITAGTRGCREQNPARLHLTIPYSAIMDSSRAQQTSTTFPSSTRHAMAIVAVTAASLRSRPCAELGLKTVTFAGLGLEYGLSEGCRSGVEARR